MQSIDIEDGELFYDETFIDSEQQTVFYQRLCQSLKWQQDEIKIFGRQVKIPRLQAWYGDDGAYSRYSGIALKPNPWTEELFSLKQKVDTTGWGSFNSVMANWYRNGLDKMGYHADDEKELGERPTIASLSLGCQRKFTLKHKFSGQTVSLELPGGSLLVMAGNTQHFWKHAIPQQKRVTEGRVNLTFRQTIMFD